MRLRALQRVDLVWLLRLCCVMCCAFFAFKLTRSSRRPPGNSWCSALCNSLMRAKASRVMNPNFFITNRLFVSRNSFLRSCSLEINEVGSWAQATAMNKYASKHFVTFMLGCSENISGAARSDRKGALSVKLYCRIASIVHLRPGRPCWTQLRSAAVIAPCL